MKDFYKYDLVITEHVSKFFGMEIFEIEFWDKTIINEKLDSIIIFHEALPQKDLAEILYEADMNISTSSWETFGRGKFEGIFVFERLENVKKCVGIMVVFTLQKILLTWIRRFIN